MFILLPSILEDHLPRKSHNLDKKMLRFGATILRNKGAAALSIREVARKAGVNLGMFNYYFDNKNEFIKMILEEAYAAFILELKEHQTKNLEDVLFSMAKFSRNYHQELLSLLGDVLSGEKNVIRFLHKNFTTHFTILFDVLVKHFNKNGYNQKHLEHAFRYLISTVGLPNLLLGVQNKIRPASKMAPDSDENLRRRIQAAVSGLQFICPD